MTVGVTDILEPISPVDHKKVTFPIESAEIETEFPKHIAVSLFIILALTILTKTESFPIHPVEFVAVNLYQPVDLTKTFCVVFPLDHK